MKTRQKKINAIYEKIARKDLSFGCILRKENHKGDVLNYKIINLEDKFFETKYGLKRKIELKFFFDVHNTGDISIFLKNNDINKNIIELFNDVIGNGKIIGHPVVIGDVLNFIQEKIFYINLEKASGGKFRKKELQFWKNNRYILLCLWIYTEYEIDKQSNKCVDFIYDLIFKKGK